MLKINGDLVSRATKLFQIILKYIGVDSSDCATPLSLDERVELVGKLYKQSLKRAELRDELFVQISKQTRNNPDRYVALIFSVECPVSSFLGIFLIFVVLKIGNT